MKQLKGAWLKLLQLIDFKRNKRKVASHRQGGEMVNGNHNLNGAMHQRYDLTFPVNKMGNMMNKQTPKSQ